MKIILILSIFILSSCISRNKSIGLKSENEYNPVEMNAAREVNKR